MSLSSSHSTILLAEDDEDHFFIAESAFKKAQLPFHLARVCNGKELIEYLTKHQNPAALILDLNMPQMDGREALRIISCHESWAQIPVLVLTTSPNEEDEMDCLKMGARRYMQKPVRFQEIIEIMNLVGKLAKKS